MAERRRALICSSGVYDSIESKDDFFKPASVTEHLPGDVVLSAEQFASVRAGLNRSLDAIGPHVSIPQIINAMEILEAAKKASE